MIDALVIGQGLSGTWLSWYLQKTGLSFIVIDAQQSTAASQIAAGIINPVTGRRIVKTWMIDLLMPFALKAHAELSSALQTELLSETAVIDFFPTVQMLLAFQKRYAEDPVYLSLPEDAHAFREYFNYDFGWGAIEPCYLVDVKKMISAWRRELLQQEKLIDSHFHFDTLIIKKDRVSYLGIEARYIIFCDGIASARNPHFQNLPFAPNKGEVLLIKIPDLPRQLIFKKGMTIVPWTEDLFWVGSSYQWEFDNELPSSLFRSKTEQILKEWLKIPFGVVDHQVAIRPATLERRPFVGFHPLHPRLGILNGMGTKGCSLAPFFASQLTQCMSGYGPIDPLADIKRFERVLSRG